jgi:hypothetical protein
LKTIQDLDGSPSVKKLNYDTVAAYMGCKSENIIQFIALLIHFWIKESEKFPIALQLKFGSVVYGNGFNLEFKPVLDLGQRHVREIKPQTMDQQLKNMSGG